jgi:hypothetical protein
MSGIPSTRAGSAQRAYITGRKRSASLAADGRRIRNGMRSERNVVMLKSRNIAVLGKWENKYGQPNLARTGLTVLLPSVLQVILQFRPVGVREVPGGSTRQNAATV